MIARTHRRLAFLKALALAGAVALLALLVSLLTTLGDGGFSDRADAVHLGTLRVSQFGLDYLGGFGDPVTIEISDQPNGQLANAHLDTNSNCLAGNDNHLLTGIVIDGNDDPDFFVCTDTGVDVLYNPGTITLTVNGSPIGLHTSCSDDAALGFKYDDPPDDNDAPTTIGLHLVELEIGGHAAGGCGPSFTPTPVPTPTSTPTSTPTPTPEVNIDIKPGSDPNSINPNGNGRIAVAILSTSAFDAPNEVDETSLTFGRTGDEDSLAKCPKSAEDVNGDGLLDQVCHYFKAELTGFQSGDTVGILKGLTVDGEPIEASDSVRIVPAGLDSDGDGFADVVEATVTTDQFAACSLASSHDAWPADVNNDGLSDITDMVALAASFGQAVPAVPARHDVTADSDGFVDISDIVAVAAHFGGSCAGS